MTFWGVVGAVIVAHLLMAAIAWFIEKVEG